MNYFGFIKHPRQAVFVLALIYFFVFTCSTQTFAQTEQTQHNEAEKSQVTTQANDVTDKQIAAAAEKSSANTSDLRTTAASNSGFAEPLKPENQQFEKSFSESKTANKQSSQTPDDDTMMGVMGKEADNFKIGGHLGFVVPIVARGNGSTTNLTDRFVFGFPVGLTVKTKKHIAIDFEFIPTFNTGRDFVLTIHPGIIYGFAKKYAVGVRAAYDAGAGSYGLTPLISRGFKINDKVGFFIEADFPIRSNYRPYQDRFGSIAFAAHAGFAF